MENTKKIEDVIGEHIDLKIRGSNFIGRCPFHEDKSFSLVVSPSKKIYKCFGCGMSGNLNSFIEDIKELPTSNNSEESLEYYNENLYKSKVSNKIIDNFNSNVDSVKDLLNFDNTILDFCIEHIESLSKRINENDEVKITSVALYPQNTIQQLKLIKDNKSFKNMYESIFNQSLVLLVSYFTLAVKDLFTTSIQYLVENNSSHFKNVKSDIKFNFNELIEFDFKLTTKIGGLLVEKNNISFQDMQSLCREFKHYFSIDIEKNSDVHNIILSQASRHAIVHALGISDEKFINQIKKATKRTLKLDIKLNDEIIFNPNEIESVINSMKEFLLSVSKKIESKSTI